MTRPAPGAICAREPWIWTWPTRGRSPPRSPGKRRALTGTAALVCRRACPAAKAPAPASQPQRTRRTAWPVAMRRSRPPTTAHERRECTPRQGRRLTRSVSRAPGRRFPIADSVRLASRLFVLARARRSLSYGRGHLRPASKVRASAGRSRAATGRPATCVAAADERLARWACLFTGTLGADPWPGRHPTVHTRWNLPAWCPGTPAPPRVQMPGDRGLAEHGATG